MSASIQAEFNNIESRLKNALDEGLLTVHYQPQFDSRSKNLLGFEALCRWQEADLGSISPEIFIPLAQELGILKDLDLYVIAKASQEMSAFCHHSEAQLTLSFNLSSSLLSDPHCCDKITQLVKEAAFSPKKIKLELTEKDLVGATKQVKNSLEALSEEGFLLSLDRFGVGATSLSLLSSAHFSEIKIDPSRISHIEKSPQNQLLVKTLISLGNVSNHIHVVAEGVERANDAAWLADNHCNIVQGFFFDKALSIDDIHCLYLDSSDKNISNDTQVLIDNLFSLSQQTPWQNHMMKLVAQVTLDHYASDIVDTLLLIDVSTEQTVGMIRYFDGVVRNALYSQVMSNLIENVFSHCLKKDIENLKDRVSLPYIIRELEKHSDYNVFTEYHHDDGRCTWKKLAFSYLDEEKKIISAIRVNVNEMYTQAVDDFIIPMRKTQENQHIRAVIERFFTAHLTDRNIEATKEFLDPDVIFVGTGDKEVAHNREDFCQIIKNIMVHDTTSVSYLIEDYKEKAYAPNVISAMFTLILGSELNSDHKIEVKTRVTLTCRLIGREWKICVYHNSSPSSYQKEGEFIPKSFFREKEPETQALNNPDNMGDCSLLNELPCALLGFYMDEHLSLHTLNSEMLEILGYFSQDQFKEETSGQFKPLIHPDDLEKVMMISQEGKNYNLRCRVKNRRGDWIWIHTKGRCIATEKNILALVGVMIDVSDDIQMQAELKQQAYYDALTKLYNRTSGIDLITQHLVRQGSGTMLLLDIDNFKYINDSFGHINGDKVLRALAKIILSHIRDTDVTARLGGDEFIVYLKDTVSPDIIADKVESIREAFKLTFIDYHEVYALGLSIGGILVSENNNSFESLYAGADNAMYEVKHSGKHGFVLHQ